MDQLDLNTFLRDLWRQGVELWSETDQLRFRGPKHLLTSDCLKVLRENKPTILQRLAEQPDSYLGFPLSEGQKAIYLQQSLNPLSFSYNLSAELTLPKNLNKDALTTSFDLVLQRHAPLRMAIKSLDGHLAQQVNYSLPSILLEETAPSSLDVKAWVKSHAEVPFDLAHDPLIKAVLLKTQESYQLLLVVHHIVADFGGLSLFLQELQQVYTATCQGKTAALPEIGKLYKDYVFAENAYLASPDADKAKAYWAKALADSPQPVSLRADFTPPPDTTIEGEELSYPLSSHLSQAIKVAAKASHTTPFIWVLTAFQTLLHFHTRENRVSLGVPLIGRHEGDYQKIAGQFTNPACFIADFTAETDFKALVETNKKQLQQAMAFQRYPLQSVIEELALPRAQGQNPLFQQAFSWNQLEDQAGTGELYQAIGTLKQQGAIFDLVLTGFDKGSHIDLQLRFNAARYKTTRIDQLAEQLVLMLEQTVSLNDIALKDFSLGTKAAFTKQIDEYNTTESLISLFKQQVETNGNAIAFEGEGLRINYLTLDELSNQRAHWLEDQGVTEGSRVALELPRGLPLLITVLAILKCRAAYVPIDPAYPEARKAHIKDSADCLFVINDQTLVDDGEYPTTPIQLSVSPEDTACILFTSGSTGKPKGVDIPHRALMRLGKGNGFLSLTANKRLGYAANVAFDACNIELWNALLTGATLVLIDDETLMHTESLRKVIEHRQLDALFLTSALFHLHALQDATIFSSLKALMTGGEAIDLGAVKALRAAAPNTDLTNLYGPTENGTVSSYHRITDHDIEKGIIPIGKALNQSQITLVTPYGQVCPEGLIGEVVVSGLGLAKGYLHQQPPAAPFRENSQGHLTYHTGDLGYYNEQGAIIYCGRADDQVKIRGYRIELDEIDAVLQRVEGIQQSCVVVKEDSLEPVIAAYFVSANALNSQEIKEALRSNLPAYMVPQAIVQLEALPLTQNGKIDKKALPAISRPESTGALPETATEKAVADIWGDLLGKPTILQEDHFFDLGGHSLLAARANAVLADSLDLDIPLRSLFDHPTLNQFAAFLDTQRESQLPAITQAPLHEAIPASLTQRRLWFVQQRNPESYAYNMPLAINIHKAVSPSVLNTALTALINKHDSLQLAFEEREGVPYLVNKAEAFLLEEADLSGLDNAEQQNVSKYLLSKIAKEPFDLTQGPLVKALWVKRSESASTLALCLHHISVDGLSVNLLLDDLGKLLSGKAVTLAENTLCYQDYSYYQHKVLAHPRFKKQIDYWHNTLEGSTGLINLPFDHQRPTAPRFIGKSISLNLKPELYTAIKTLSAQLDARPFALLSTAFALVLAKHSRDDDIAIGFPVAGRSLTATQSMAGLFVNNLVLRHRFDARQSIKDHLKTQTSQLLDALSHQDVPFDIWLDPLNVDKTSGHTPFLQASLQFEEESLEDKLEATLGADFSLASIAQHHAKYDLNLCCTQQDHTLALRLDYAAELFEEVTVMNLLSQVVSVLDTFVMECEQPIGSISLATKDELNNAFIKPPQEALEGSVLQTLTKITQAFPDKTAVTFEAQSLTFAELDQRSNQVANRLIARGVAPQDYVGLSVKRDLQLVISLLGILKAGAAYIPIDPSSPEARKQLIAADADLNWMISDNNTTWPDTLDAFVADDFLTEATTTPNVQLQLEYPAYVIYTSGTTGKPKGCPISHRNLARLFATTDRLFDFSEADHWCLFHSYAFDFSVWELFGALLHGGTLHIVPEAKTRQSDAFYDFLADRNITVLNQTPSAFTQLIKQDEIKQQPLSLRHVIFGGEKLDYGSLTPWVERHSLLDVKLTNMYGITEVTVHASYHPVTLEDIEQGQTSIGQALPDMQFAILDHHGQLAPVGMTGEIAVFGGGITGGYIDRPKLTASKFISHSTNQTFYLSGDLGKRLPSDDIAYLGRKDQQVSLRGFRIELGEIKSQLTSFEGIQESHVSIDETGNLIAYCLVNAQTLPDRFALREHLKARLPAYMLPKAFVLLGEWPLTTNGKLDETKLPTPTKADSVTTPYAPPRNETESTLVDIWQQVLGISTIGIQDNFFELGGHSLLATQINAAIQKQLQTVIPLKTFFEKPTIEALAVVILENSLVDSGVSDEELLALLDDLET